MHKHHIIPRYMGGQDSDGNLVELSVPDHALAHKSLWEKHGNKQDYLAWKMLEGQAMMGENLAIKSKLGWEKVNANGPICKGRIWFHNPKDPTEQKMLFECPTGWVAGRGKIKTPNRAHCKGSEKQRKTAAALKSKAVTVKGKRFDSIGAAASHFNITRYYAKKWSV